MQLTMTLVRGVSEREIAWVVRQGVRHRNVRLVAMLPAFFSGRYELEPDPLETGRALGVRAVFTARMHQIGDVLIIRAELVDAIDGSQIWGEQFRRKLDDLLAIDQEISQEICEHLRLRWDGAAWWLEDLHSKNGTLVNRQPWAPGRAQALPKPALITIGDVVLEVID